VLKVEAATEVTPQLMEALTRLIPQLSSSSPPPAAGDLARIVEGDQTTLLVARGEDQRVVGTLTLVLYYIPTGVRAVIEDVVVDEAARGQGVGEALTRAALEVAAAKGARTVDLTSRPSRQAANRLYERLGFQRRETNVWRYTL
jgi:ribosomal protein S18 acetylase RimI-like enzyme